MPIQTMDDLVKALAYGQRFPFFKSALSATSSGTFVDLLTAAGIPPAGSVPSTGAGTYYDNTSAGAVPVTNAAPGQTLYVVQLALGCTQSARMILYDRIWAVSGFSGTVTTPQSPTTPPTLPRWQPGDGVECWLEVYTALGATSANATLSYTNSDGQSGRTSTVSVPANAAANRMFQFPLQPPDRGVQTVASVTLSQSTGTAGNFGLTLLRRLAEVDLPVANVGRVLDAFDIGMPVLPNGVSLFLMQLTSTATTGTVIGGIVVGSG